MKAPTPKAPHVRFSDVTKIPTHITRAWRETIIELAKFPKGTKTADASEESLLRTIVRVERAVFTQLWKTFTSDRGTLTAKTLTDKRNSVAYLLGFHLPNVARTLHSFTAASRRWDLRPVIETFRKATIVDIGCGSGAMAQSSLWYLRSLKKPVDDIEIRLVDTSAPLLDTARVVLQKTYPESRVRSHRGKIDGLLVSKYLPESDAIGIYNLGYIWNEIAKNPKAKGKLIDLVAALIEKDAAALVIVAEPGSQDQSRAAMILRNRLTDLGYQVQYPCPNSKDCPLLERSRDWCYSEVGWTAPPMQKLIDRQIGVERTVLASTSFVFATPRLAKMLRARTTGMEVVVGRPLKGGPRAGAGGREVDYLTCSEKGIKKVKVDKDTLPLARGELLNFTITSQN